MWETQVRSLGWEDPPEKEMATHSSIHAWKIPWTEEPGRLQSTGSQSRRRLSDFISLHLVPREAPQTVPDQEASPGGGYRVKHKASGRWALPERLLVENR